MINNTKLFSMLLNIRLIRSFSHKGKHRIRPTRQQIRKHVNQENLVLLRHKAANMPLSGMCHRQYRILRVPFDEL